MMRALGLSVLFVLVVATIVWMRPDPAPPAPPREFAPLSPEGETPAPADAAFRESCFKSLEAITAGWTFGDILFTQSRQWGQVLRADYTNPDLPGPNVNRVICSRGEDGKLRVNVTMGQKVAPLGAARAEGAGSP
jgi:hypothetical protein